mgnify:CR=1 FL=1
MAERLESLPADLQQEYFARPRETYDSADAAQARKFGAEGIGLCRTEHMFFGDERLPVVQEMILADNEPGRRAALDRLHDGGEVLLGGLSRRSPKAKDEAGGSKRWQSPPPIVSSSGQHGLASLKAACGAADRKHAATARHSRGHLLAGRVFLVLHGDRRAWTPGRALVLALRWRCTIQKPHGMNLTLCGRPG